MNVVIEGYKPLLMYASPASIPQIVAHIQEYLIKNPIVSIETIAQIIVQALQEHPELLNGSVIPISDDSEQSIKAYIDSLPLVDGYTKAEINLLLTGKQDTLTFDQTPTPGSSNPVTSSGIIAAMSALQSSLETMINRKADAATTYTKNQVDTKLLDKANVSDVYTKNTMDAKLLEINTDISDIEDDIDRVQTDLSTQSQQIDNVEAAVAYVEDGNTASRTYTAGQYVLWKGSLYTVNNEGIASGTAITGHVTAVSNGGFNTLNNGIKAINNSLSGIEVPLTFETGATPNNRTRLSISGKNAVLILSVDLTTENTGWNAIATFDSQYSPRTDVYGIFVDNASSDNTFYRAYVQSGTLYIGGVITSRTVRGQISWIVSH